MGVRQTVWHVRLSWPHNVVLLPALLYESYNSFWTILMLLWVRCGNCVTSMVGQVRYLVSSCFYVSTCVPPIAVLSLPVSGHHGFNDPRSAEEIVLAQVVTTKDQYSRRRVCVIAFVQMTLLVMQETYFFWTPGYHVNHIDQVRVHPACLWAARIFFFRPSESVITVLSRHGGGTRNWETKQIKTISLQCIHDKTVCTGFQKNTIRQCVEQEWTMVFVEIEFHQISVSCHPIAPVGVHVFEEVSL